MNNKNISSLEIKPYNETTGKTSGSEEGNIQSFARVAGTPEASGSKDSQPSLKLSCAEMYFLQLTRPPAWPPTKPQKPKLWDVLSKFKITKCK